MPKVKKQLPFVLAGVWINTGCCVGLGEGGFATVFAAHDLIEDRKVALKIPDERYISNSQSLEDMQREVRIMAKLDHSCVLPLKDARFIDGHFVIVFPLGEESLADRLSRRISRVLPPSIMSCK